MNTPGGFRLDYDLRASPRPVGVALILLGLALTVAWELLNLSRTLVILPILVSAMAVLTWLTADRRPWFSRWLLVIGLVATIILFNVWFGAPGFLTLLAVPTVLAAALLSPLDGLAVAVGEALLLLVLRRYAPANVSNLTIGLTVALNGSLLGIVYLAQRPVRQLVRWALDYYQRAEEMQREAGESRAEITQALSDLEHAHRQLALMNQKLAMAYVAAEEAHRAKATFVANVSHELRTPLNMVIGFTQAILDGPETYGRIPPSLLADLSIILRNSQHLSGLIDDVLDLSQIEAGQMALTKERVSLAELAEATAIAVRPLYESKGLYLKINVPESLPLVLADRTRLREVFLNLLSNAGRFTEHGGVEVRAWAQRDEVVIGVADTGPGIAAEDMERLFKPFQQLDESTSRRFGGSGLGLSISRSFVEMHGGKMWLESEIGHGATFYFSLPIGPSAAAEKMAPRWLQPEWEYRQRTQPSQAPTVTASPSLLVVEQGHSLQRLLSRYLDGVEIVPVASLERAVAEVERLPALALLINDSAVLETLERVRERAAQLHETPVIICSVPGTLEAATALGVSSYLTKPVARDDLIAALDRLNLRGRTVLVIDDEPDAARLFRRMLRSMNRKYRVLTTTEGRQGLQLLREEHPDVVLLDLIMPELNGFEIVAEMKKDAALRDIPVIVLSARDPTGHPMVTDCLAVTRGGGLAVPHLLNCIKAIISGGSPRAYQPTAPEPPAERPG